MYPLLSHTELLKQPTRLFVHRIKACEMHRHQALETLWALKGSITVRVNDQLYSLNSGDLLVINANEPHATQAASADNLILCLQHRYPTSLSVSLNAAAQNVVLKARQDEVRQILAQLWWEQHYQARHWHLATQSQLTALQLIFARYFGVAESEPVNQNNLDDEQRIQQICLYLDRNHQQPIPLSHLAEQFGLTESYLSHYFKAKTGTTLVRYLSQIRLEKCLSDLLQTDQAISTLALASGFPSIKAFNSAFKREYGCTPSDFKQRQQAAAAPIAGREYGSYDTDSVQQLIAPWLKKSALYLDQ